MGTRRRLAIVGMLLGGVLIGVAGTLYAWGWGSGKAVSVHKEDGGGLIQQGWRFEMMVPADLQEGEQLLLEVRQNETRRKKGESYVLGHPRRAMGRSETVAISVAGKWSDSGGGALPMEVGVELVDLSKWAVMSEEPGKNLRALYRFSTGGGTTFRAGKESIIEGERFGGYTVDPMEKWEGNELYLMSFYTVTQEMLRQFDVVVVRENGNRVSK